MTTKLRDFIRSVRCCKAASEERGLIQKELAAIRGVFKEGKEHYRARCMLKMLYITMLGYPTEFGQMEVIKLIAQPQYSGKRIGYLTMSIILDERSEVLTLAENHIKKDLGNTNPYIQSLALDTVANIAGEDMSRDVLHEVQRLVDSSNVYLKKKACLAALRIVKKAPEHSETFCERLPQPFNERNHGALITSLGLINECLAGEFSEAHLAVYRLQIPAAVRMLKQLVLSSKITDHDVSGVSDPFLQVRILQFLRLTGSGNRDASDTMNDVLAQVITNTDSSRNVGNAVIYEAVRTIIAIESDDSLRALAITALGRFLTCSGENNIRYVALSSLVHVMRKNPAEVQEHHATIVDCLKDVDYSIRRLALQLTIALIDDNNIRIVVPDLLHYLQACGDEAKSEVTSHLCGVILHKAPTPEWRVEMALRLLKGSRQHVPTSFALELIAQITRDSQEVKEAWVRGLWEDLNQPFDATQQIRHGFLIIAMWCVGEYSHVVKKISGANAETVLSLIATITTTTSSVTLKQYGLTSMMKIASRYPAETKAQATAVFENYAASLDCELQQRALEYITLLEEYGNLSALAFAAMPPIEEVETEAETLHNVKVDVVSAEAIAEEKPRAQFLDDIFADVPAAPSAGSSLTSPNAHISGIDDVFGQGSAPAAAARPQPAADVFGGAPKAPGIDINDLFGGGPETATAKPASAMNNDDDFGGFASSVPAPTEVFRSERLTAGITASRQGPHATSAQLVFTSVSSTPISNVAVYIAVPKTSTITIKPLSSTSIAPRSSLVQEFSVVSAPEKPNAPLMLRVKLEYTVNGSVETQLFQATHDPR